MRARAEVPSRYLIVSCRRRNDSAIISAALAERASNVIRVKDSSWSKFRRLFVDAERTVSFCLYSSSVVTKDAYDACYRLRQLHLQAKLDHNTCRRYCTIHDHADSSDLHVLHPAQFVAASRSNGKSSRYVQQSHTLACVSQHCKVLICIPKAQPEISPQRYNSWCFTISSHA